MALLSEMIVGTKISESAYLCLRLAWLYEGRVTELIRQKADNSVTKQHLKSQLEIRHYEKVIPQLVGEVGRIAQQGVQVAHHGDHGTRLAVALATVFDQLQRVDHLLDMTPILGQVQLASCVIIILFHIVFAVLRTVSIRPPERPASPLR